MLVPEAHPYGGGTWAFYVIAPLILCGVVASFWLIVKGAIGVFAPTPCGERLSTIPWTTGSSSRTAAANEVIGKGLFLAMTAQGPAQATVATPHPPSSNSESA